MFVYDCDIRDVDHVHATESASPPGVKRIMRAHGEPANRAEPERTVVSKAHKEDKRGRPHWPVVNIDRSRPPPRFIPVVDPASLVTRPPAPRLIANPCPAVERL